MAPTNTPKNGASNPNARPTGGSQIPGFNPNLVQGTGSGGIIGLPGSGSSFPTNGVQPSSLNSSSARYYKGGTASVGITSYQDAFAATNQVYQQLAGRNATPDEIQAVLNAVNSAEYLKGSADIATAQASQLAYTQLLSGGTSAADQGTQSFLNAVKQHESSGNYQANSGDGAYGAYQFTPDTWNSMARESGYKQYANGRADQAPAAVQDAVATHMANKYYNEYGSWELAARAWYDPAYVNDPSYVPPGNNGLSIGAYGQDIVNLMGGAATQGAGNVALPSGAPVSPVGAGLTQGRVDQGVDYSGKGPLYAVGSGQILSVTNAGWPGKTFIALKLDNPVDAQHSVVYYAEDINAQVSVGEHVGAGRQIGTATGGSSGIEIGWGDPNAIGRALAGSKGDFNGQNATPEGQHFLNYISGAGQGLAGLSPEQAQQLQAAVKAGGGSYLSAMAAQGGGSGTVIDNNPNSVTGATTLGGAAGYQAGVNQNPLPTISPVAPGGAASETVGQGQAFQVGNTTQYIGAPTATVYTTPPSATDQAIFNFETQQSPQFQEQNLVNVFSTIQQMLGAPKSGLSGGAAPLPVP